MTLRTGAVPVRSSPLASRIWGLCVCQGALAAGQALAFPFLSIYLVRDRGLPLSKVGAWLSLSVLVTALSQGLGGELSDMLGQRRVMVLSLGARGVTVFGMAAAIQWRWPFLALMSLHLTSSFVANFFDPAARSWIADHTGNMERHRAYGWLRIATNLGFAAGPAAGGMLMAKSYASVFGLSAAVCMVCALAVMWMIRDLPGAIRRTAFQSLGLLRAAADPLFLRLCIFNMIISVAMAQLVVSVSVFSTQFVGLSAAQVGLLFSLNGLLVVILQYPATAVLAGMPLTTGVVLGCVMYAAGFTLVGFSHSFLTLAGAMVVITFGEVLVPPAIHSIGANMAPSRARGRYIGFLGLSKQMGSALGPLTGGLGLQYVSSKWAPGHWLIVGLLALSAAVAFHSLSKELSPSEQGLSEVTLEDDEIAALPTGA